MSGLKTYLAAKLALVWLILAGVPGPGAAGSDDQLRVFANCAGRLSALMEHQWMFDGPGSEDTAAERALLIDLIEAIMPANRGREVLAWRIDAKMAHAMLLNRAAFSQDPREAVWAARMAERLVGQCRSYLLS